MKRTGIFGGSFDPVHSGHVRYANFICDKLDLDELIIIPAKLSPFKKTNSVYSPFSKLFLQRLHAPKRATFR